MSYLHEFEGHIEQFLSKPGQIFTFLGRLTACPFYKVK